ncbi:MAG TPA: DUF2510 domain-containing protein, partial [Streptosporangiaceae bacterium]|nr:DUF2510 domain-containing protein [Streptosporangiaceae bacterium]
STLASMDLPPSGWYPDPFGVPGLLRWWDGSTWTHHTHADAATDADGGGSAAAAQPGTSQHTAVQAASVQATTVQPTTVQPTTVQPTTVQPAVQLTAAPPAASMLATTVPQPVLLPTAVQPAVEGAAVQPTTVQPTTVQPTTVQPTTVQPAGQPGAVQPTTVQPLAMQAGGAQAAAARGHDGNGTQVLFLGDDAWTGQGAPGGPNGSGGAPGGDRYGYQRVQRRRRIWVASGLAGGTVVALGVIVLVVNTMGQSSVSSGATQAPAPTAPVAAATSAAPSPSPSATATGTASTLADGQTGLSYAQLAAPWGPTCPGGLNSQGFSWTAGESALAGQVNGGQTTWYGAACSAPLPQQYGYNGVADLANVTTTLANQFNGSYYQALSHNYQQELSQPVQVSGHAGWEVKFLITYTNASGQGLAWSDEMGAVVVADSGTGAAPAVFYVSVPGNLGETNVDTLVSSLQLSVTPQEAASASASASATTTSPAPGNGNGDGNNP